MGVADFKPEVHAPLVIALWASIRLISIANFDLRWQ
jgi:hypothetical protein